MRPAAGDTRRTIFRTLRKARLAAHILEGLTVALANVDAMIRLIKTSESPAVAKKACWPRRWGAGHGESALLGAASSNFGPEDLEAQAGLGEGGWLSGCRPRRSWKCA